MIANFSAYAVRLWCWLSHLLLCQQWEIYVQIMVVDCSLWAESDSYFFVTCSNQPIFLRITTIVHNLFFETFETVYSFFLSSSSSSSSRRKEILIQTNFQFSKMEQTKSHHFSINKFCPENDIALSRPQNFFYFFFFSQKRITQFLSLLLATAYKLQRLAPSAACSSVYLKNIFIGLEYAAAASL